MASIGSPARVGDTESSLEKIKRQLTSGSGRYLLQGPLLKRSETLRKWNERWMILDPTNGKMEYKTRRHETVVKGTIIFDSTSTITLSPLNFHGLPKYEGCCLYIGTPQKKEYFLCAETPGAARAWISTLHATQLVLRAHKEAVNSLSGNGSAKLGTVATVVAAANATAMEASKEIETAMKISMRAALGLVTSNPNEGQLDDLSIMKETLRVKDEELSHLAKDLRARDSTIREIADKLTETAEAAQAAATAAHLMDEERRLLYAKIEYLKSNMEKEMESSFLKICAEKKMKQAAVIQAFALFKESEEKVIVLSKEREILLKQRETAFHEAQLWRSELAKARERAVVLEGAVIRAEEKARVSESHAEARRKEAIENVQAAEKGKEELLALVNMFQSQVQRQESSNKEVCEERSESSSHAYGTPLTKHVDLKDDVDKACLSDTRLVPVSENSAVPSAGDGVDIRSIGEAEWGDMQLSDARMPDVREISPEVEGGSLDIPVVSPPVSDYPLGGSSLQP